MLPKSDHPPCPTLLYDKKAGPTTTDSGRMAEDAALNYLLAQGLRLVARNYKTPGRGGGEIDLIVSDRNGTLVFVEVRKRRSSRFGGAAASIGVSKQRRLIFAAHRFLLRYRELPPCRFDVITVEDTIAWIQGAFEARSF